MLMTMTQKRISIRVFCGGKSRVIRNITFKQLNLEDYFIEILDHFLLEIDLTLDDMVEIWFTDYFTQEVYVIL